MRRRSSSVMSLLASNAASSRFLSSSLTGVDMGGALSLQAPSTSSREVSAVIAYAAVAAILHKQSRAWQAVPNELLRWTCKRPQLDTGWLRLPDAGAASCPVCQKQGCKAAWRGSGLTAHDAKTFSWIRASSVVLLQHAALKTVAVSEMEPLNPYACVASCPTWRRHGHAELNSSCSSYTC